MGEEFDLNAWLESQEDLQGVGLFNSPCTDCATDRDMCVDCMFNYANMYTARNEYAHEY